MRITLSGTEYERWRNFAQQWNKRSRLPALRAATYVSDGENVFVRCTNLQYWLQKPIFARADGKGVCVVPSSVAVSEPTVELCQTKQAFTLNERTVDISEYEPFALPIPLDELAPIVRCYRADLINALKFALPAIKADSNDNRMHGVRIASDGGALLVEATDSHRAHQKRVHASKLTEPTELVVYATADLVILLNLLSGTTVSIGVCDETAYISTDKNELIFWQHTLAFPNIQRVIPDPNDMTVRLRASVHAIRNACKSLGKPKQMKHAKTYCETVPDTNQLVLTCAESQNTVNVQLYSAVGTEPIQFAIDRNLVLDLVNQLPSHATVDIGVYMRYDYALTDWRVVGNDAYYALISGMAL